MLQSDIKIVDLNRCIIDKEASDPKKGKYRFKKGPVYINIEKDYKDSETRPKHIVRFNRYEEDTNYAEVKEWERTLDAELVVVGDPYWPEPLAPDAEGHYVFQDSILMKIPFESWMEKRRKDVKKSEDDSKLHRKQFQDQVKAETGSEAEIHFEERKIGL